MEIKCVFFIFKIMNYLDACTTNHKFGGPCIFPYRFKVKNIENCLNYIKSHRSLKALFCIQMQIKFSIIVLL